MSIVSTPYILLTQKVEAYIHTKDYIHVNPSINTEATICNVADIFHEVSIYTNAAVHYETFLLPDTNTHNKTDVFTEATTHTVVVVCCDNTTRPEAYYFTLAIYGFKTVGGTPDTKLAQATYLNTTINISRDIVSLCTANGVMDAYNFTSTHRV